MNCCVNCKHFKDAKYSKVYISPRCTVIADDDAMYMRRKVCGLDGRLFEQRSNHESKAPEDADQEARQRKEVLNTKPA